MMDTDQSQSIPDRDRVVHRWTSDVHCGQLRCECQHVEMRLCLPAAQCFQHVDLKYYA
jgi:hypothetical protein